ncbi:MAG: hypothetical protein MUC99_06685 [Anaerolineae bacterium]|jgi:hypothetical protein|nr:hypothetical protein [Anaerolineae bacterium]
MPTAPTPKPPIPHERYRQLVEQVAERVWKRLQEDLRRHNERAPKRKATRP